MSLRVIALIAAGCGSETQLKGPPAVPQPEPTVPPVLELPGEEPVEQDPQCSTSYACPRFDPAWDAALEWEEVLESPDAYWWVSMPVVADLDGDGSQEIAVGSARNDWPSSWTTYLSVWRGDGGGLVASFPEIPLTMAPTAVTVGDVDGDGQPEMVVSVMTDPAEPDDSVRRIGPHQLAALRLDGTVLWRSEPYEVPVFTEDDWFLVNRLAPVLEDLDGDGTVEVFADGLLFDGASGELLAQMPEVYELSWGTTALADLDLDGVSEILHVGRVLNADTSVRWELDAWGVSAYPTALQLDEDEPLEVLFATGNGLHAHDTDGSPLWDVQLREGGSRNHEGFSSPCVADFDGDGQHEIVSTFGSEVAMFERDGTQVWSFEGLEYSISCAGFDFDLDGRAEVALLGDGLRLLCGADGKSLYHDATLPNLGAQSYPVVADLDGDGSAEIVTTTGDIATSMYPEYGVYWETQGETQLLVYGHPDGLWPATSASWPQYDMRADSGEVHSPFAQGEIEPFGPPEVVTTPDLALRLADQLGDCDGLALAVQVENHGTGDAPAGQLLIVESVRSATLGVYEGREVRTLTLPAVPAGLRLAAMSIELSADELDAWGVRLYLPPDPSRPECDPDDQELLVPFPCP